MGWVLPSGENEAKRLCGQRFLIANEGQSSLLRLRRVRMHVNFQSLEHGMAATLQKEPSFPMVGKFERVIFCLLNRAVYLSSTSGWAFLPLRVVLKLTGGGDDE
jgi:hypothetical protein